MEALTGKFVYGGSGSKKTYDQCIELFTNLMEGKKIWVATNSPKKYRRAFFKITGKELLLEKTEELHESHRYDFD